MAQLHKKFSDSEVKQLIERYLKKEVERSYLQELLGIGKTRFFSLIQSYRDHPQTFSIQYHRQVKPRLPILVENNILKELSIEKKLIQNKEVPLKCYNYSYVKDQLEQVYRQKVSVTTIIRRAKKHGFYLHKPKRSLHDREVLTRYAGELIQHDASIHLWSPLAGEKWYLITSLDDFSRFILYAILLKQETAWAHIAALESVFLKYGLPYSYYVDCHSIFRFVRGRDDFHYRHHAQTDELDPQWKQVLEDCNVKVIYALSPQAKGKIERPYRWLQDHLVRTCVRNNVTDIRQAQGIVNYEIHRYNYRQVHSTTGEVPYFRFQRALKEKVSLFREFKLKPPYQSPKDIFCLRLNRTTDAYRKISLYALELKVNGVDPGDLVNLRIYPLGKGLCEVRFWSNNKLVDVQKLKNTDFKGVHF
jgi:hypothetical protein